MRKPKGNHWAHRDQLPKLINLGKNFGCNRFIYLPDFVKDTIEYLFVRSLLSVLCVYMAVCRWRGKAPSASARSCILAATSESPSCSQNNIFVSTEELSFYNNTFNIPIIKMLQWPASSSEGRAEYGAIIQVMCPSPDPAWTFFSLLSELHKLFTSMQ